MGDMPSFDPPRDLNEREHDVLAFILATDFAGAEELRAQIPYARVESQGHEGSPNDPDVDIVVSHEAPAAPIKDGPLSVGCNVHDSAHKYQGEILIWVTGGYLSGIEYAWVSLIKPYVSGVAEERPIALPPVTDLTLV